VIRAWMPSPPERMLHEALLRVERAYNAAGITSVIDPGLGARGQLADPRAEQAQRTAIITRICP